MQKPYKDVLKTEMILRDSLALDRTILANERTLLSYIRTTLAVIVVGATLLHLSTDPMLDGLGIVCIVVGIGILVVGVKRTLSMSKTIYQKQTK